MLARHRVLHLDRDGRAVRRIHLTKDGHLIGANDRPCEFAPRHNVFGCYRLRRVSALLPFDVEFPEALPKVFSTLGNLFVWTINTEALVSLTAGLAVAIGRAVSDGYSDGFGESVTEALEKLAMSSAASVTCP